MKEMNQEIVNGSESEPQEIIGAHKSNGLSTQSTLDKIEKIARILSTIAIPVLIAFGGLYIQDSIATRSVRSEYLQIALDIIRSEEDDELRNWAVDLLAENSPTEIADSVVQGLKTGEIQIPVGERSSFRSAVQFELTRLQEETINDLGTGLLTEADNKLQETEFLIDYALRRWPDDIVFMNLRGYHHKNLAMTYQRLSMDDKADENLSDAEEYFTSIISLDEEDASAWNGLGSVYMLRCELDQAEEHIRKALEINPEYAAARRDLERIPEFRDFCSR